MTVSVGKKRSNFKGRALKSRFAKINGYLPPRPLPPVLAVTPKLRAGQWVVNLSFSRVAQVRSDSYGSPWGEVVDLVFYSRTGKKVGRESEPLGGPRGFEPACSVENWLRIQPPAFPEREPFDPTWLGFVHPV